MVTTTEREGGASSPLAGKRILITRSIWQADEFARLLESYGAEVISFPTIEIAPPEDWRPMDKAIAQLGTYDWVIFTSVNGVRSFTQRLKEKGREIAALAGKEICAIGPRTQNELEDMGLQVTFLPPEYRAEAVAHGLRARGIKGKKILLPRAKGARKVLPQALMEAGGVVDEVQAYRTVRPSEGRDSLEKVLQKGIDVITFTSSSTVRNFMEFLSERSFIDGVQVAVIGPVTGKTARRHGLEPTIVAPEYTIPALIKAIVTYFENVPSQ